jgi:hypothetical protein
LRSHGWWYIPVIPALRRLRGRRMEVSLGYIARLCLNKTNKTKKGGY